MAISVEMWIESEVALVLAPRDGFEQGFSRKASVGSVPFQKLVVSGFRDVP